ncbi:MFS transporter [Billgrantia desiderata]|uniref:MFS transporter n=1 Tax=Billgrantia desiderata TaxID=52021 RepID=A0ABS9B7B7_9GAMM|nr:MFS transporter [Halomonas desiderata]MCE8043130.1 MFS transporter [Halomonas desiderata]MCE8047773.1 MFS transporter [Halomonas desiderata]SEG02873.1 Nitrate/nitrite transporter NarK [Halomonas desiderata]
MNANSLQRHALTVIVFAQLCGTSLWFSVNGVGLSLSRDLGFSEVDLGRLTLAVQAGFICGTLFIATTGLADRFRASRIFAASCLAGALVNGAFVLAATQFPLAVLLRFVTGLCLAGIYPLGMKLVIGWTPKHTGAALSWLVGMLTLGTAMPHLLRGGTLGMPWEWPLLGASLLALLGGAMVLRLGDGPHLPPSAGKARLSEGLAALGAKRFRAVAGGYFGHCWELYAFWMLTPFLVMREVERLMASTDLVAWLSFGIIALGLAGCVGGGALSRRLGSLWVARWALTASGVLCLIYPLLAWAPPGLLLALLFLWGLTVIADSPQFSALAAATAPRERVGSTLAVMNAIGFALTIPAISLTTTLWSLQELWVLWWLLPGPILGLWALRGVSGSAEPAPARQA